MEKLRAWCQFGAHGHAKALIWCVLVFRVHTFCFVKKRKITLDLQVYSWIGVLTKKTTMNSKYYREHQRSCDISIMLTCLMTSKLSYLHMDCETFNWLHQSKLGFLYRALLTSLKELFVSRKKVLLRCFTVSRMCFCRWIQHSS